VAAARVVTDAAGQEIFVISAKAQVIRVTLEDFRVVGRDTQGVIIWRDREPDDYVASIAAFQESNHLRSDGSENGHQPANGDEDADAS
jgi:DNA gyrase/topoisomerase IV subunit A